MKAKKEGHREIVKLLLANNADINLQDELYPKNEHIQIFLLFLVFCL